MKNYLYKIIVVSCSLFFVFNCGSSKGPDLSPEVSRKTLKNAPKWFMNTPEKEGYRYTTATATSQDMQLAVNKARLDAAQNLAGQVSSEMNGLVKRAQEETGLGADSDLIDQFSQTQEQVIATSLKDWKVSEKEIQEEKSNNQRIYRAYVLIEWDEGAANKRLLQKIKEDEKLYTLMRSTELFEEMDEKVEKYRKRYSK
jgi:hypothetical protein|tara:strand:- start:89 stop:685 length:597 start_codon:yes stop_codon:yes gene_type:complete